MIPCYFSDTAAPWRGGGIFLDVHEKRTLADSFSGWDLTKSLHLGSIKAE